MVKFDLFSMPHFRRYNTVRIPYNQRHLFRVECPSWERWAWNRDGRTLPTFSAFLDRQTVALCIIPSVIITPCTTTITPIPTAWVTGQRRLVACSCTTPPLRRPWAMSMRLCLLIIWVRMHFKNFFPDDFDWTVISFFSGFIRMSFALEPKKLLRRSYCWRIYIRVIFLYYMIQFKKTHSKLKIQWIKFWFFIFY